MRWMAIWAVALSACGEAPDARVHIDLASLWQQSAQSVDTIHVRIYDDGGVQQFDELLKDMTSEALFEVTAGILRFEVEALTAASAPSFFGDTTQAITAGDATVDVLVPVFPAGGVAGMVSVSDGTAIPAGTVVVCTADAPRADAEAPNQRSLAVASDGTFAGTLVDGATTLSAAIDVGTAYSGSTQTTVVREQNLSGLTILLAP